MRDTDKTDAGPLARPPSPDERQATVDRLCTHFARDTLTASELESRLDLAYAARTRNELVAIERDLPDLGASDTKTAPPPVPTPTDAEAQIDPARPAAERDLIVSIWGSTERKGAWTPPRRLAALTVMGGTELDFREAQFASPEVSVQVVALMGGVEVIVPPGVRVEWAGIALMGGVTTPERLRPPAGDGPLVRITGLVCMGGVEVVERLPGESAKEARTRLKRARKARRKLDSGR